jgi:hypothetical protein
MDEGTWIPPLKPSKKVIARQAKLDKLKHLTKDSAEETTPTKKSKRDGSWKKEPPKNNKKTKIMYGRTFNWCKWHKAWVIHDPATCLLQKKKATRPTNEDDDKPKSNPKALKVDPALKAVIEDESDEVEYDE